MSSKRYYVTAPCFGTLAERLSRSAAYRFARKWEKENSWGRGVASVGRDDR
jgi:hypothetical protein